MTRLHRAEVTAARLVVDYERYHEHLSANEKDAFKVVIQALREIPGADVDADEHAITPAPCSCRGCRTGRESS